MDSVETLLLKAAACQHPRGMLDWHLLLVVRVESDRLDVSGGAAGSGTGTPSWLEDHPNLIDSFDVWRWNRQRPSPSPGPPKWVAE